MLDWYTSRYTLLLENWLISQEAIIISTSNENLQYHWEPPPSFLPWIKSVRNRGFSGPNAGNYGPGTLWIRILFTQCCPLFYGIALGQTLRKNAIRLSDVDQPLFTWDRSRKYYICQDHICNDSIIFAKVVLYLQV